MKFLEAQRDFLQFKADTANAALHALEGSQDTTLRQQAEVEKSNLQIVMCQQEMLAELAIQQQKSLRDLELLLMQSPLNHYVRVFFPYAAMHTHVCILLFSSVFLLLCRE